MKEVIIGHEHVKRFAEFLKSKYQDSFEGKYKYILKRNFKNKYFSKWPSEKVMELAELFFEKDYHDSHSYWNENSYPYITDITGGDYLAGSKSSDGFSIIFLDYEYTKFQDKNSEIKKILKKKFTNEIEFNESIL